MKNQNRTRSQEHGRARQPEIVSINDRVKWIDLGQTSKLADPAVLQRAVGKADTKGEL